MTEAMSLSPRLVLVFLLLAAVPAAAQPVFHTSAQPPAAGSAAPLPPGLQDARLLAGWTDGEGKRVLALELQLLPGWKTYWRSPGDTGLPPRFDWSGSRNLRDVTLHWPAPEAIQSGDSLELGYHDRLVLPLTARPADPGLPLDIRLQVELGLCENICVPARLALHAPDPGPGPVPAISAALAAEPRRLDIRPACRTRELPDGLRLALDLPQQDVTLAAVEVTGRPEIWVSGAELRASAEGTRAVVEMAGPGSGPLALDPDSVRLTWVSDGGAMETLGCDLHP
jgi:DsbC/DsbD-like thiol-disulfide interchange protein